ncbi:hypothetical protein QTH97_26205 [Variovorax sp. J22R24]|uniref:hypothetical protein n=1 Tax=Variovorax gracilis TaxID=3053502 RepID=UPI00257765C7|nr:hypothetical protein [Variovorax sp. J22R24]MDM0108469.1 hypothetical protein [Variovorax sp. J22R24]
MSFMGSAELESIRLDGKDSGLEAAALSSTASRPMLEAQRALAFGRMPQRDTERDKYFARSQGPLRLLSPEEVRHFAATSMLTDLSNPNSAVRRIIGNRRPALNPFFAQVAPAEWIDRTTPKE